MQNWPFLKYFFLAMAIFHVGRAAGFSETNSLSESQRIFILTETLQRLEGDLETNPRLKTVVNQLLEKVRGTSSFVQIVKKFNIKNQEKGLFEVALKNPANEIGVEAMQIILANPNSDLIKNSLQSADISDAIKTAEVLGNTKTKTIVPLLWPIITDPKRDLALRKQAVRSLAQTLPGANDLLALAKEEKLPNDLRIVVSSELNGSRWPKIKSAAREILPLPPSKNPEPLPPLTELKEMKGDVMRGEKVFFRAETGCSNCHQIKGRGREVGPNLSEIGAKLGKDALFESILNPSAGISMGFEAFNMELKNGDEVYGLLASETADELAIRDLKGIVTRYKKSDVTKREQSKLSIMPTELEQTMSTQELVDLVEFLFSLKKTK
ncbi:MAG: c-type cytochrome [Verrucomicrobiota bacterium]|nr:c-type cytochrome [Verrucomicrobiota bacterium]